VDGDYLSNHLGKPAEAVEGRDSIGHRRRLVEASDGRHGLREPRLVVRHRESWLDAPVEVQSQGDVAKVGQALGNLLDVVVDAVDLL